MRRLVWALIGLSTAAAVIAVARVVCYFVPMTPDALIVLGRFVQRCFPMVLGRFQR